jgi:hypothetical protein
MSVLLINSEYIDINISSEYPYTCSYNLNKLRPKCVTSLR